MSVNRRSIFGLAAGAATVIAVQRAGYPSGRAVVQNINIYAPDADYFRKVCCGLMTVREVRELEDLPMLENVVVLP